MPMVVKKYWWVAVMFLVVIPVMLRFLLSLQDVPRTSTTVERGTVERAIAVSGFLEADQLVALAFPTPSRITDILVREGDQVAPGDLLVTAGNGALAAERQRAVAQVTQAEASRDELLNGLTLTAETISSTTVSQARAALEATKESEARRINQAYTDLLATDLEAKAVDAEEPVTPPIIAGSYQCEEEGVYTFELYRSDSDSGYSIRYDGLERGLAPVSTTQPVVIGECGIELIFSNVTTYRTSAWEIAIPNTLSETYIGRLRAYELVQEQAQQNIEAATYALALAEATNQNDIAPPRTEAILAANAAVMAAQADIARIDALLRDQAIYAPFAGTITNITGSVGEIASGAVLQLVANDTFTLVARIPEIDLRNLESGLTARVSFDAAPDELLEARVDYISPVATVIDGVSYFEANLSLPEPQPWFRDGLNADVDIIITKATDALRIPSRFITPTPTGPTVLLQDGTAVATTSIEVVLQGTDGYTAITGLAEDDTLVAP